MEFPTYVGEYRWGRLFLFLSFNNKKLGLKIKRTPCPLYHFRFDKKRHQSGINDYQNLGLSKVQPLNDVYLSAVPLANSEATPTTASGNMDNEEEQPDVEINFSSYHPILPFHAEPHPEGVVENGTLSTVSAPDITYPLQILTKCPRMISEGRLSDLQVIPMCPL